MYRFFSLIAMLCAANAAFAHFVFIVPKAEGAKASVVLSEDSQPDPAVDIGLIAGSKLFIRGVADKDVDVKWTKGEHEFTFDVPGTGPRTLFGTSRYGVMERKGVKPFLLTYHPKAIIGDFTAVKPIGGNVPIELVPERVQGKLTFQVLIGGKPAADVEVNVSEPGSDTAKKVKSDAAGKAGEFKATGRYAVWAKSTTVGAGQHDGKKFDETRIYATLVIDVPAMK